MIKVHTVYICRFPVLICTIKILFCLDVALDETTESPVSLTAEIPHGN